MKTVEVGNLTPGMIIAKTVFNADFLVILLANTVINEKHILILKSLQIPGVEIKDDFDLSKIYQTALSLQDKNFSFIRDVEKISKLAQKIYDEVKAGGEIKAAVTILVSKILPIIDNHATITQLFKMNNSSPTLANHGVRVAIIAGVIAKWMRLPLENIRIIVTAAFLHDIGKYRFPPQMLAKFPTDLKGVELQLNKTHCQSGRNLLQGFKFAEPIPTIVFQHHECMNGSGFPMAINGQEIHQFAKIVAVADAYDRMITERPGFTKKTPFEVVRMIANDQYSHYDPFVCMPFITGMKDHLLGANVTLKDGRTGKVVFYPKDFVSLPLIKLEDETDLDLNQNPENLIVDYDIT